MKKTVIATLTVGTLALGTAVAFAHGGATGIVKERMDQMVVLKDAMKVLKNELAAGGTYDAETVIAAAREVKSHSGEALTAKFPEGSLSKASEALPSIWTDWERFSQMAADLEAYAGALEIAATNRIPNDHAAGMGGGMIGHSMKGGDHMMGGGMMGGGSAPDAANLATMPPIASFQAIANTCSACHTDFRKKMDGH